MGITVSGAARPGIVKQQVPGKDVFGLERGAKIVLGMGIPGNAPAGGIKVLLGH
jgi:hypothetical protein